MENIIFRKYNGKIASLTLLKLPRPIDNQPEWTNRSYEPSQRFIFSITEIPHKITPWFLDCDIWACKYSLIEGSFVEYLYRKDSRIISNKLRTRSKEKQLHWWTKSIIKSESKTNFVEKKYDVVLLNFV